MTESVGNYTRPSPSVFVMGSKAKYASATKRVCKCAKGAPKLIYVYVNLHM